MAINREKLADELNNLPVDGSLAISSEISADIFSPGLEDVFAFVAAANFVADHQCNITRDQATGEIQFTKSTREVPHWEITANGPRPIIP